MANQFFKAVFLYPISLGYGIVVSLRNWFFDTGICTSTSFDLPIISVGNITVGGTGKTPHAEYLLRLLKHKHVALLSRGYKRKSEGFLLANQTTTAIDIGDEPYQIAKKFPEVVVAVDADRVHGVRQLLDSNVQSKPIDVIVLDDAFQHRKIEPGLSILLIDHARLIHKDHLLPYGRLRERKKGRYRADIVIVTKCPRNLKPIDFSILSHELKLYPFQHLFFTTFTFGAFKPVFASDTELIPIAVMRKNSPSFLLVTGVVSPQSLLDHLKGFTQHIDQLVYSDHHDFTKSDIETIMAHYDALVGDNKYIVVTEKDAARLVSSPFVSEAIKPHIYAVPIEVTFLNEGKNEFDGLIKNYLLKRNHSRLF